MFVLVQHIDEISINKPWFVVLLAILSGFEIWIHSEESNQRGLAKMVISFSYAGGAIHTKWYCYYYQRISYHVKLLKKGIDWLTVGRTKGVVRGGVPNIPTSTTATYSGVERGWLLALVDVAEAVVEDDFVDEVVDVERESEVRVSESIFIKV